MTTKSQSMLGDKWRTQFNADLKELLEIREHAEQAVRAKVPAAELLLQRINQVVEQINTLKAEYWPNKR